MNEMTSKQTHNANWQPAVGYRTNSLPPYTDTGALSDSASDQQGDNPARRYTKTSLAHHYHSTDEAVTSTKPDASNNQQHQRPDEKFNRRILTACQSYNSTPKPFVRQASVRVETPERAAQISVSVRQANSSQPKLANANGQLSLESRLLQITRIDQTKSNCCTLSQVSQSQVASQEREKCSRTTEPTTTIAADFEMSPKLVHQQYNSPMNLYSMNNIRKTIEARSELLAPGVKGINFMKSDAPVNKQSEVLKLIKEEEEERRARQHQQRQQRMSPISVQPVCCSSHSNQTRHEHEHRRVQYAAEQSSLDKQQHSEDYPTQTKSILKQQQQHLRGRAVSLERHNPASQINDNSNTQEVTPKCFECDQTIVGPFAKIQDRCIHPHCFNCSTCGTSLKNSGYFTINDKLYCEIHARQVANVMRLNYNFEPNKQAVVGNQQQQISKHHRDERAQHYQLVEQRDSRVKPQIVHPHAHEPLAPQPLSMMAHTVANRAAADDHCAQSSASKQHATPGTSTISTMFSGMTGSSGAQQNQQCAAVNHGACSRVSEIRWTWRPAGCSTGQSAGANNQQHLESLSAGANSTFEERNKHESRLQASSTSSLTNKFNKFSNLNVSTSNQQEQLNRQNESRPAGPVCCNCQLQIYGPYILAGKSIWCKSCSKTNFVCQSCHCSLLNIGFIEDSNSAPQAIGGRGGGGSCSSSGTSATAARPVFNCEHCFETRLAPVCSKCHARIRGDCLNALGKHWHPTCFVCGHCRGPFGNSSFYLEDDVPYCERDWNLLFTTKCYSCGYPIGAGDKWIEALTRNYHSDCFRCTGCQVKLEGSTFHCKAGKPYCQMHARY